MGKPPQKSFERGTISKSCSSDTYVLEKTKILALVSDSESNYWDIDKHDLPRLVPIIRLLVVVRLDASDIMRVAFGKSSHQFVRRSLFLVRKLFERFGLL